MTVIGSNISNNVERVVFGVYGNNASKSISTPLDFFFAGLCGGEGEDSLSVVKSIQEDRPAAGGLTVDRGDGMADDEDQLADNEDQLADNEDRLADGGDRRADDEA